MSIQTISATTENFRRSKSDPSSSTRSKIHSSKSKGYNSSCGYLSLITQIQSGKIQKIPISEYQPTRKGEGAYWRSHCSSCESMKGHHMGQYDDEDDEYQQYLHQAIKESLKSFCDKEMCHQLCQMVITSPQKPSRIGQYELSRSYQLTKKIFPSHF